MEARELWQPDATIVRRLRCERGWSRSRLAQTAGVSHHTVAKIERGDAVFPSSIGYVAAALGVSPEILHRAETTGPTRSSHERGLLEAVQDKYGLYQAALAKGDLELLRIDFPQGMSPTIRWTHAMSRPFPYCGEFRGFDGVRNFFEGLFDSCRQLHQRVECVDLLTRHGVLSRGSEVGLVAGIGKVTAVWLHWYQFDRRAKVTSCHSSYDVVSIEAE